MWYINMLNSITSILPKNSPVRPKLSTSFENPNTVPCLFKHAIGFVENSNEYSVVERRSPRARGRLPLDFHEQTCKNGKSLTEPVYRLTLGLFSRFSAQALFYSSSTIGISGSHLQIQPLPHETHKTHFLPSQHLHKDPKTRASNQ
jgi:hypothetical protein